MRERLPLAAFVGALACAACGRSDQEISRAVDERLAAHGLLPSAAASASAGAPPASSAGSPGRPLAEDAVDASFAFLRRLDELMDGYEPSLAPGEDKTDLLRCVTSYATSTGTGLEKVADRVAKERAAQRKLRQKLRDEVRPLNFRIDLDWKTRGSKRPAQYGCWAFTADGSLEPSWMEWRRDEASCAAGANTPGAHTFGVQTQWRVRVPEGAFTYTYSGTTEPPAEPPELMRRMAASGVAAPARFACPVADVTKAGKYAVVRCEARADAGPLIRASGEVPPINIGDVVSAPLDGMRRDPDGVLLKWSQPGGRKAAKAELAWTVDADGAALRVERRAACPTADEIAAALSRASVKGGEP